MEKLTSFCFSLLTRTTFLLPNFCIYNGPFMLELELLRIGGRTAAALEDSATVFPSTGDEERLSESAMVGCVCQEHELLLGAVMVGARRNRSRLRSHSLRENEMAAKKEAQSAVEIEEKSERPTTRNWHRQVGGRRVLEGQSFE